MKLLVLLGHYLEEVGQVAVNPVAVWALCGIRPQAEAYNRLYRFPDCILFNKLRIMYLRGMKYEAAKSPVYTFGL